MADYFVSDHAVTEKAQLRSSLFASLPAPCSILLRSGPISIYEPLWRNVRFDRTWNSAWLWNSNISTTDNWFTYRCLSNSCRIFVRSADTGIFNEYICWISGACNIGQLSNEYSSFAVMWIGSHSRSKTLYWGGWGIKEIVWEIRILSIHDTTVWPAVWHLANLSLFKWGGLVS